MFNLRYIPFVVIGVLALAILIINVKKNKFSEKESIIWAFAGLVLILSPFYMDHIDNLALLVGVTYAPSLIFAVAFLFVFFLIYRLSASVHKLNERIIELIQLNAIYENELRSLKEQINKQEIKEQDSSAADNP